jgi:transcriptional regulator with XRE-family HTH domain
VPPASLAENVDRERTRRRASLLWLIAQNLAGVWNADAGFDAKSGWCQCFGHAACLHTAKMIAIGKVCCGSDAFQLAGCHNGAMAQIFIKEWRLHRGMTQPQLGEKLDPPASAGTISAYESGKREVSMDRLRQIADALKATPGSLLDGPPVAVVPAEVLSIWSRIPVEQRDHARDVLKTFAAG